MVSLCAYALAFLGRQHADAVSEKLAHTDFGYLLVFIGVACYSIEGIGLIFPLRKDYIKYNSHEEFTVVYFLSFVFTVLIYLLFGVLNYLRFYGRTANIVFYNYNLDTRYIFVLEVIYSFVSSAVVVRVEPDESFRRL